MTLNTIVLISAFKMSLSASLLFSGQLKQHLGRHSQKRNNKLAFMYNIQAK